MEKENCKRGEKKGIERVCKRKRECGKVGLPEN